ncbi:hypothetical protein ACQKKX_04895 [Neorhizobium sp. NPDC001467]|uniref:hypothetical protein n=1 Tax=Neorhizobium sp. NPDC001467 TaxID=3390595 RepID=UPI003D03A010
MLIWLSSSIGKIMVKWTAFVATGVAIYWKIYAAGKAAERPKQAAEKMDAVRERQRFQDAVSKMPTDRVRDELLGWVRDDG